jgi:hypothetical protein
MRFLRTTDLARVTQLTVGWGVIFAAVHAYWAAGGETGTNGDPADTVGVQIYIAVIALLGLVGAAVARGLARNRGRRLFILMARAGAAALLLGVVFGIGRWLADWSLDGDGATGIAITLYFLLGGLLFTAVGWHREVRRPTRRPTPACR